RARRRRGSRTTAARRGRTARQRPRWRSSRTPAAAWRLTGPAGGRGLRAGTAAARRGRTPRRPPPPPRPCPRRNPASRTAQHGAGTDEPVALMTEAVDELPQWPGAEERVVVDAGDVVADGGLLRGAGGQDPPDRSGARRAHMGAHDVPQRLWQHRAAVDVADK